MRIFVIASIFKGSNSRKSGGAVFLCSVILLCANILHVSVVMIDQDHLRVDNYKDVRETIVNQDGDPRNVGQEVLLPATFCGGTNYRFERQQDAMA